MKQNKFWHPVTWSKIPSSSWSALDGGTEKCSKVGASCRGGTGDLLAFIPHICPHPILTLNVSISLVYFASVCTLGLAYVTFLLMPPLSKMEWGQFRKKVPSTDVENE